MPKTLPKNGHCLLVPATEKKGFHYSGLPASRRNMIEERRESCTRRFGGRPWGLSKSDRDWSSSARSSIAISIRPG